jgi:bifunctional non-homologous end joining protein LigD
MTRTKRRTVSSFAFASIFLISVRCWGAKRSDPSDVCKKNLVEQGATTPLPKIGPVIAKTRDQPFDDPGYLFEMKYDGFRGMAYVERGRDCRIFSRNKNLFSQFQALCRAIAAELNVQSAIFDGEVIAPDPTGRPIFERILRRQGPFRYVAFDLLWLNGRDLRSLPLESRRQKLLEVLPKASPFITESLVAVGNGVKLFNLMVENDLEGIVAKRLEDKYTRSTRWYKIKNKSYSQSVGRRRFFRGK